MDTTIIAKPIYNYNPDNLPALFNHIGDSYCAFGYWQVIFYEPYFKECSKAMEDIHHACMYGYRPSYWFRDEEDMIQRIESLPLWERPKVLRSLSRLFIDLLAPYWNHKKRRMNKLPKDLRKEYRLCEAFYDNYYATIKQFKQLEV